MSEDQRTTILLVRHGQTEWNAAGRVQGQTNSDLTELGRRQAEAVARWLTPSQASPAPNGWRRPTALYSSDLDRARQTVDPIARALGITPKVDPGLREMSFGELEGLSWYDVERSFPQISLRLWGDDADHHVQAPGGESRAQMHARSSRAIEAIARRHPGETVLLVSHGGVIGFFLRGVVGIPFDLRPSFSTPNGSVAAFGYAPPQFKLLAWGLVPSVGGDRAD